MKLYELIIEEIDSLKLHNTACVHFGAKKSRSVSLKLVDGIGGSLDLGN